MDNIVGEYSFSFMEGDSYCGFSTTITTREIAEATPLPIDLTGASIQLKIQSTDKTRIRSQELSTYNNKIVITDAVNGQFSVVKQKINLPSGIYEYSLQVKYPNGSQKTYLIGNCEVLSNSTSKSY